MEVKINKEIREYTESIFFGLSLRQFIFSILAVLAAVGIYFGLQPFFGLETTSWLCIIGAAPFAAVGFIKYNGMTAEQFLWAWIKFELFNDKKLCFKAKNIYFEAMKQYIDTRRKEELTRRDQDFESRTKTG